MRRAIIATLFLLAISPLAATAATIPPDISIFPPGSIDGPSSYELSFALEADSAPTHLHFDGSVQNSSFANPANVSFWFDWTDTDGTTHTSDPESFALYPITGAHIGRSSEFFTQDFVIPYSPANVSVHFTNNTAISLDGRPVLVSGTFEAVPEPGSALFFAMALMGLLGPRMSRAT